MSARLIKDGKLQHEFTKLLASADEVLVAVAWGSAATPVHSALLKSAAKVTRLVVGLHFHQTDPKFIRAWRGVPSTPLRLVQDTVGIFHPKVYLFRRGSDATAIVGSANFTKAAFDRNTEASILLTGKWGEAPFTQLRSLVEAARKTVIPTDAWLEKYALAFRRRQTSKRLLETEDKILTPDERAFHDLAVDFKAYADLVRSAGEDRAVLAANGHEYTQWIGVLEAVKDLPGWPSFTAFDDENWKLALGVVQYPGGDRTVDYRLFGWTRGLQKKRLLASSRARKAIELIPPSGSVSTAAWRNFVHHYCDEFNPTALTTASRLLALKRPDLFLSANVRSIAGLAKATGKNVRDLDDYWHLHQVIWSWPWARASRPKSKTLARIWEGRVALLDVLFYDPT